MKQFRRRGFFWYRAQAIKVSAESIPASTTGPDEGLVTVIVPVYNGERYVMEAINSIVSQSYRPIEVVVVDDGSTDTTADVTMPLSGEANPGVRIRYEKQTNSGAAAARNRGVELANGNILAFLDADDVWAPNKLSLQILALENNPDRDAVFGHMQQFISPELDETTKLTLRCPTDPMPGYTHCTMLIRREAFMRVGMFETDWHLGEFVAWYLKAIENTLHSTMLPDVVLRRRLHDRNQGVNKRDFQTDYVRILKASLDRRRHKARST